MIAPVSAAQSANTTVASNAGSGGMNTMFLSLLTAELKAQDPTAPLDANQMVGQMVSLNQLNELIQIRELLQGSPTTSAADATGAM